MIERHAAPNGRSYPLEFEKVLKKTPWIWHTEAKIIVQNNNSDDLNDARTSLAAFVLCCACCWKLDATDFREDDPACLLRITTETIPRARLFCADIDNEIYQQLTRSWYINIRYIRPPVSLAKSAQRTISEHARNPLFFIQWVCYAISKMFLDCADQ